MRWRPAGAVRGGDGGLARRGGCGGGGQSGSRRWGGRRRCGAGEEQLHGGVVGRRAGPTPTWPFTDCFFPLSIYRLTEGFTVYRFFYRLPLQLPNRHPARHAGHLAHTMWAYRSHCEQPEKRALHPQSAMAIAETAARKILHGGAIARGVADVGGLSFSLWDLVAGFFANILAALAGVAHLLVLPLEMLWQCLVAIITGAAAAIGAGLEGLWQHVTGFFTGIFSALASLPHLLVLPLEKLWQWLATAAADAAGAIGAGLDGLWQHVTGFFTGIFSALASLPHLLVLQLEKIWQWLATTAADAADAISSGADGLWKLATGFFPQLFAHIFAALAGAAHEVPQKLEELWRWLKAAAAVALPFVVAVAAVLLLVALVWFCGAALCNAAVGVCRALVSAVCHFGHGLFHVAVAVHQVLALLLPRCVLCLNAVVVTMKAPGAAGLQISRAAFEAAPALYFQILRAAGPVVAAAVFCLKSVALLVAAPVAALFRVSVGA